MKTPFQYFIFILLVNCVQPPNPSESTAESGAFSNVVHSALLPACEYHDIPSPSSYTGPVNPEAEEPGWGTFIDENYARGWRAGYLDGAFYHDLYGGEEPNCSNTVMQQVQNTLTGVITTHPFTYAVDQNEQTLGVFVRTTCNSGNWLQLKCLLRNDWGPKTYRLQLEFNRQYSGLRTQAQENYDSGKLNGFEVAITSEPFSVAP